ncbi:MAG: aspartate aminotransferase [Bacteroidetes bacterium HGW-Bacteroidetes-21]|nr:MAG: aspartate aminotransferase [Bacteroidetes bacterium HGW-Bacteroidetes-21]
MGQVSERLARLSESQTLAMAQKSRELKAQGVDVINLSIGEPDFNTPDHIKEAAKKAIDDNYSHYSPVPGYDELKKAVCRKFKRENNLDFTPDQIVVSNGAKHSIANVILSLINQDDEVIIPTPYWVSYVELVKLARGKNVLIDAGIESDYKIKPEQIEAAITPRTKLFLFSSPSNPTGSLYTREELKAFADVFARHPQVYVISDEIYEHINFIGSHESIAQFPQIKDQVIVVNGVSKGYAMTGWRIGYIGAPQWIAKACNKLQGQMTSGASSIAQIASVAALDGDNSCIKEMCATFKKRRDILYNLLKEIPGLKVNLPQGAFYLFVEASYFYGKTDGKTIIKSTNDLALYILNDAFVALVDGSAFGAPDYIRFSYAASEEQLINAAKRIKTSLLKLV